MEDSSSSLLLHQKVLFPNDMLFVRRASDAEIEEYAPGSTGKFYAAVDQTGVLVVLSDGNVADMFQLVIEHGAHPSWMH